MDHEQKSNKKLITILVVIFCVLVIGLVALYFVTSNDKDETLTSTNEMNQKSTNTSENTNTQTKSSTYIGDDFTILQPAGWVQSTMANTLASFIKQNETQPSGSPAEKIHFRSYMAVSFDKTNNKTLDETYQESIDAISATVFDMNIISSQDETINDIPSKLTAMEFTSQDVVYTVLLALYQTDDKYYSFSFNTTTEEWPEYNTVAYQVARSFQLK